MNTPLTCLKCGGVNLTAQIQVTNDAYLQLWCTDCETPFFDTTIDTELAKAFIDVRRNEQLNKNLSN